MLLVGIVLIVLFGVVIGLFIYFVDDVILCILIFWNLGSLNGVSYL